MIRVGELVTWPKVDSIDLMIYPGTYLFSMLFRLAAYDRKP